MKVYCLECDNELFPPHYVEGQFQHDGGLCDECREREREEQEKKVLARGGMNAFTIKVITPILQKQAKDIGRN